MVVAPDFRADPRTRRKVRVRSLCPDPFTADQRASGGGRDSGGAPVQPGSGDGPLSVRARPSSLKSACASLRDALRALLTPETSADTPDKR